uniref:Uncharacterized protein n=1 Tax=Fagus sylvatica TaxID=28930 RepID=A0A2N9EMF2_FAGSY
MVFNGDLECLENTRMDRHSFHRLCDMLKTTGRLSATRNMNVEEMVAMFLHIVAHDVKNRVIKRQIARSGETISRQFNKVLNSIIRLYDDLLEKPEPVPEDSTDSVWKWFKNCLGALDGTYIKVNVLAEDRPRYRTRKNEIATNVLGVCTQDLKFIYVLTGWEGSAADSRILRNAVFRTNGLRAFITFVMRDIPMAKDFLRHIERSYSKVDGQSLARNVNMKHCLARNVIERCFGLLKGRWAILRTKSFYPVKIQCRIITACCLLHNHIRREMPIDPLENELSEVTSGQGLDGDVIRYVETSDIWSTWRDDLAKEMFNKWRGARH